METYMETTTLKSKLCIHLDHLFGHLFNFDILAIFELIEIISLIISQNELFYECLLLLVEGFLFEFLKEVLIYLLFGGKVLLFPKFHFVV